jgi:flavin reductase (DIM6/NTAB) family NADH-FMN oxidoreductase RutF
MTGLNPVKSDFVDAPYIDEFPLNLECKVVHIADLGVHTQFIGEIVNVKIDGFIFENSQKPIIEQIIPQWTNGLRKSRRKNMVAIYRDIPS